MLSQCSIEFMLSNTCSYFQFPQTTYPNLKFQLILSCDAILVVFLLIFCNKIHVNFYPTGSRLEDKVEEMKTEYSRLHDRYTELFKTHVDYMERTKILLGTDRLDQIPRPNKLMASSMGMTRCVVLFSIGGFCTCGIYIWGFIFSIIHIIKLNRLIYIWNSFFSWKYKWTLICLYERDWHFCIWSTMTPGIGWSNFSTITLFMCYWWFVLLKSITWLLSHYRKLLCIL